MLASLIASFLGPMRRMANVMLALLQAHIILARSEAKRDSARILAGLAMGGVAMLCLVQVWLMAHVLAVLALRELHLPWVVAVGAVTGADALLGVVLALLARGRLSQPVMPETRELIRKTIETAAG